MRCKHIQSTNTGFICVQKGQRATSAEIRSNEEMRGENSGL